MSKFDISQPPGNYSLMMAHRGTERVLEQEDIPLLLKLRVYTTYDLLHEPTFAIVVKIDDKAKKTKAWKPPLFSKLKSDDAVKKKHVERNPSDLLESFLEKFSDRSDKSEKLLLSVELEIKGRILFQNAEFPVLAGDTAKQFIQNGLSLNLLYFFIFFF